LRRLLDNPADLSPEQVASALRRRGVERDDADLVRRWLVATVRRNFGNQPSNQPELPSTWQRVIQRLRRSRGLPLVLLCLAWAGRASAQDSLPANRAVQEWRNLGAVRWMALYDVGAAAAWIHALAVAPRDPLLRREWRDARTIPSDVRGLAPRIPVGADEYLLGAGLLWIAAWLCVARRFRRAALLCMAGTIALAVLGVMQWRQVGRTHALVRQTASLRVSPHPAAPALGEVVQWSSATIERTQGAWVLVRLGDTRRGWLQAGSIAPLGR
jgi:hypothetical protein